MKRLMKRNSLLAALFFVCAAVLLASCSKDEDRAPEGGGIDTAVGTLQVIGGKEFYNAVINVSKVDDSHLKIEAKSGQDYSTVAPKKMKVSNNYNKTINTLSEPNGSFLYSLEDNSLVILTNKT